MTTTIADFKLMKLEMGSVFDYNEHAAYPIYILKSNGQVDCLVDYES